MLSYYMNSERMERIFDNLKKEYRIFGPKRVPNRGWNNHKDLIRYGEAQSFAEIVFDEKSDFSPKEVFYPIVQTLLYFEEAACAQSELADEREILLFLRPCDINGIRRLDTIMLKNGDQEDNYYLRLREKLKFALMECKEGWEQCFCVAMGANWTDQYSLAVRKQNEEVLVKPKDPVLEGYFAGETAVAFEPEFVSANQKSVTVPQITGKEQLKEIHELPMWQTYNDRCISCGGCNTVCISCSCFDTIDILYNETSRDGERRRVWSSCMLEDFSMMAGGHQVRKPPGERMRFKTLHKIYDYQQRFGAAAGNMCVGCGRCDARCPQDISFSETINALSAELLKQSGGSKESEGEVSQS